jgi:hypothetical protein
MENTFKLSYDLLKISERQNSLAKLKNFFAKLIFFSPNFFCLERFPLSKIPKKKFWREKINLAKRVGPFPFPKCQNKIS